MRAIALAIFLAGMAIEHSTLRAGKIDRPKLDVVVNGLMELAALIAFAVCLSMGI